MRRLLRILADILIVLHCVGFVAVLWTGGYEVELLGVSLRSHSLLPVIRGLVILGLVRILLVSGVRNFLLVVGSLAFTLVCAEILIRIWDPPLAQPSLVQIHRPSDVYDWELIPGAKGVGLQGELIQINSLGFRDREGSVEKPPGVKRIAVLGDSFTFGMAVNLEDTYVKQLEHLMGKENPRIETLNFGVIGYHMWQYLALLERRILEFDPDLIVIGLFLDDIMLSVPPYTKTNEWKGHNPFEIIIPDKHKGSASRLWNLIRNFNRLLATKYRHKRGYLYLQSIDARKQVIGPQNSKHEYYKAQIGDLDKQLYDEFLGAMERLGGMAKTYDVSVIILYIPDSTQLHEKKRQHVNRFVRRSADRVNIPLVDVTPIFEQVEDPRALYLFPLDAHTSAEGHRIMALALANEIRKRNLLK